MNTDPLQLSEVFWYNMKISNSELSKLEDPLSFLTWKIYDGPVFYSKTHLKSHDQDDLSLQRDLENIFVYRTAPDLLHPVVPTQGQITDIKEKRCDNKTTNQYWGERFKVEKHIFLTQRV